MRRFVVVLRAESAARFRTQDGPLVISAETKAGQVQLTFRTRYSDEGLEDPVPREMWIEARGEASCSLDDAMREYIRVANLFGPLISVTANAPVGHMTIHLAYDATPDVERHEFFENFLPDERGRPTSGRAVAPGAVHAVLSCLDTSTDRDRFLRSIEQYRQATQYWRPGWETFAVIHLWMAVEAITKVALRRAIESEDVRDEDELIAKWGLADKRALDGEVRRRLVFHGDAPCQADTRKASDGFEHGFLPFDTVNRLAVRVRDRAAQHVRHAILELLGVPADVRATLTSSKFDAVRASWPITLYVRGEFVGPAEQLAATDQEYPMLRIDVRLTAHKTNLDGSATISFNNSYTPICGDGVLFVPKSYEVWAPERDVVPSAPGGDATTREDGGAR